MDYFLWMPNLWDRHVEPTDLSRTWMYRFLLYFNWLVFKPITKIVVVSAIKDINVPGCCESIPARNSPACKCPLWSWLNRLRNMLENVISKRMQYNTKNVLTTWIGTVPDVNLNVWRLLKITNFCIWLFFSSAILYEGVSLEINFVTSNYPAMNYS